MSDNTIHCMSVMQNAFVNMLLTAKQTPLHGRILALTDNIRLRRLRAVNVAVSFRTAQKLKAEGVLA